MRIFYGLALVGLITASGCKKNNPPPDDNTMYPAGEGVFVGNEGGFQQGNASISYYDISDEVVEQNVFSSATSLPLGDICHSMTVIDDELYIVVNNSGKIEVVEPGTFETLRTIQGFISPRFITKVAANKAYVTNLFGNQVDVVDLSQGAITASIPLSGWSEEVAVAGNKAFITNYDREQLYVVDITQDKIVDSIAVNIGGISLEEDKNGKLWLLCSGDYQTGIAGSIHRIDPATNTVEQTLTFQQGEYPTKLRINGDRDELYMILQGIRKMDINATMAPDQPIIERHQRSFYGLDVDPQTGEVYVADARDYSSQGVVLRYTSGGALIDTFEVGISPSSFLFY